MRVKEILNKKEAKKMRSDKENEALDKEVIMEDHNKIMKLAVKHAIKDELVSIFSLHDQEEKSKEFEGGENFPFDEEDCPTTATPKKGFLDPIIFTPSPRTLTTQTPHSHLGVRDNNIIETWAEKIKTKEGKDEMEATKMQVVTIMAHGFDFKKELKRSKEFHKIQEEDLEATMLQAIERWLIETNTYIPANIYPMMKHHSIKELDALNNFQEISTQ